MTSFLQPVWSAIEKYIDSGISVIPVRDKDEGMKPAKSPYGSWKRFQSEIISKDELFELMDSRYNTTAIGIVGGKVSGNLEIIDIDVKYNPGIDAILFTDIKDLYPDLAALLRIHKSPSGGYHILYRCTDPIDGNQKLAGKLDANGKKQHFIETRGEGGYVVAPPSLGYSITKDKPIPVLSASERNSLLSLCKSYNEIITPERPAFKPTAHDNRYYDKNPFEDFNDRCDPTELVESLGWKYFKSNNHFIWYTRPGKSTGVSLSFNLQKRFFYCFTASTELDPSRGYTPANILSELRFSGDKKQLYAHLVAGGYGNIKPKIEARIAKSAAINNKVLPANASPQAIGIHAALSATLEKLLPHGPFWIDSVEDGVLIDRENLLTVAGKLGFNLYNHRLILSRDGYIEDVDDRYFFDTLKNYIKDEDEVLRHDICVAFENFIEKHGKFIITRLPILHEDSILHDTEHAAYKCYSNGILKITATDIELLPSTPLLIWRQAINDRNFIHYDGGLYNEFLRLAMDTTANRDYIYSIIGYLAHEYKDETAGYIIVLTEQCEDPLDGGGAGKNVFSELFKYTTSFISKPGSLVKYDEKFMQSWNWHKIYCISDAPKNFNFSFLKELSTGTGLMKKLFKDEQEISSDDMPKFLIQTNFSYQVTDGGLRRRIKQIEFTDFFTLAGGLDVHFNAHFPKGWTADDWAGYDTTIARAIQKWLSGGRKIGSAALSDTGWIKQFEQTWGQVVYHFISQNIAYWQRIGWLSNDQFKRELDQYFIANNTPPMYQPSMMRINKAIKDWCDHTGDEFSYDEIRSKERGKVFGVGELPF